MEVVFDMRAFLMREERGDDGVRGEEKGELSADGGVTLWWRTVLVEERGFSLPLRLP